MGPCYAWALVVYGGQGLHTCATTWVASRSSKSHLTPFNKDHIDHRSGDGQVVLMQQSPLPCIWLLSS